MAVKSTDTVVPLIPLRDIIIFPHMVVPLFVGRDKSIKALEFAMGNDKSILLSAQKKAKIDDPSTEDIFTMGTLGTILQLLRLPDGTVKVLVEGKRRARIKEYVSTDESFMVMWLRPRWSPARSPCAISARPSKAGRSPAMPDR